MMSIGGIGGCVVRDCQKDNDCVTVIESLCFKTSDMSSQERQVLLGNKYVTGIVPLSRQSVGNH